MGDLEHVTTKDIFTKANTGLAHTFQMINVEDYEVRSGVVTLFGKSDILSHINCYKLGTRREHSYRLLLSKHG